MASNSKNLGELLNTTTTVSPAFVSDQDNTSTGYFDLPNGTTAQRPTAASGMIRYNSTLGLAEYYDGTQWKSIDSPPVISSISPTVETDANATITINGSNFQSGATVNFVGNDGTEYASPTVSFVNNSRITATTPSTALSVANEPYDVVVNNPSGLSGTLADGLDAGGVPAFNESAGSLGTLYHMARTGISIDAGATDPDGDTITYSISAGSIPSGLSFNTSTGAITGTASAVGSDTTSTFTVSAATASDTSTRQFTIEVKAPIIASYTSTGSGTFTVPTGLAALDVLVVAGGGGSGVDNGGGGGAGGLIYRPAFPVTPGGSISYTVGDGGGPSSGPYSVTPAVAQQDGQDSVFGTLTAKGGGTGASWGSPNGRGYAGGSSGGSARWQGTTPSGTYPGVSESATQPSQPGDSGTYGFGNPGGGVQSNYPQNSIGGGGGGAGAAGAVGTNSPWAAGPGGAGKQYAISGSQVYYAAGGGGGSQSGTLGQGVNGGSNTATGIHGAPGDANRGAGASGGTGGGPENTGKGGSGIVIVSY